MKIGLIGPADEDLAALRAATELLIEERRADVVLYLGADASAEAMVSAWAAEVLGELDDPGNFLQRAATIAERGQAPTIAAFLEAHARVLGLDRVRELPPAPARAVELIEDRIVLAVHDKAVLDEDDIVNAQVIAYGKSQEPLLRRFGPRCFVSPGPLKAGHVGVLASEGDERLAIELWESEKCVGREVLGARLGKVVVAR